MNPGSNFQWWAASRIFRGFGGRSRPRLPGYRPSRRRAVTGRRCTGFPARLGGRAARRRAVRCCTRGTFCRPGQGPCSLVPGGEWHSDGRSESRPPGRRAPNRGLMSCSVTDFAAGSTVASEQVGGGDCRLVEGLCAGGDGQPAGLDIAVIEQGDVDRWGVPGFRRGG